MRLIYNKLRTEKNYIRKMLVALLIVFVCAFLYACNKGNSNNVDNNANITNESIVYVDFINVGKGDCMVIRTSTHVFMIDTGYEETSDDVIAFLEENDITTIDGMIITHFDKDHVGGATDIIKKCDVKAIYMPDYVGEGTKYAKFMEKLNKWNMMNIVNYVTKDVSIDADGVQIDLYAPKKTEYSKENDYSIITKLTNKEDTFIFAADAQSERIEEVLGESYLNADVLKLPYHGFLDKQYIKFIDEVSPRYGIITCDCEADVSESIIYELENINAKYYFNCNGNIHCVSDGTNNIEFTQ